MSQTSAEFKRIGNGYSIVFPCTYCEQMILTEVEAIGGMAVCSVCHRAQDVPPVPCRYGDDCNGVYQRCGGHLSPSAVGDYGQSIFCDECGAVYPPNAAPEKCIHILCSKCRRPIQ